MSVCTCNQDPTITCVLHPHRCEHGLSRSSCLRCRITNLESKVKWLETYKNEEAFNEVQKEERKWLRRMDNMEAKVDILRSALRDIEDLRPADSELFVIINKALQRVAYYNE